MCFNIEILLMQDWRNESVVMNAGSSSRGTGLDSQHPFGGIQLWINAFPRDQMLSFVLHKHLACMGYIEIYVGKTTQTDIHTQIKQNL